MSNCKLTVGPLPIWLKSRRLLPKADWVIAVQEEGRVWLSASLPVDLAGQCLARMRGLVLAGCAVECVVDPALRRTEVREARSEEARNMRDASIGFSHKRAKFDEEGRWSLTPEKIAVSMARGLKGKVVIDATAGLGGNAIGFARVGAKVVAIEQSRSRLELARQNIAIYGLTNSIKLIHGDSSTLLSELEGDLLFIDPPWRGLAREVCGVADLPPLQSLVDQAQERMLTTWVKLPPSFEVSTLPNFSPTAVFGVGEGDRHRIKFLLLKLP